MTRKVKYQPQANRFHGAAPRLSVMHAFETAVLLMEQSGVTEEDIMKYVHMIHQGWIREGALAPEYLELCRQAQRAQMEEAAAQARVQQLHDSIGPQAIVTDYRNNK